MLARILADLILVRCAAACWAACAADEASMLVPSAASDAVPIIFRRVIPSGFRFELIEAPHHPLDVAFVPGILYVRIPKLRLTRGTVARARLSSPAVTVMYHRQSHGQAAIRNSYFPSILRNSLVSGS